MSAKPITTPTTPPVKGRYIMLRLLRQFLTLKPADQHQVLIAGDFTVDESISLAKAFNGAKYHKLRRRQANFLELPEQF